MQIICKPDCHCANCRPDLFIGTDLEEKGWEKVEIVYSGAPGWFDFYIDGHPRGCARAKDIPSRVRKELNRK
jgi:hypothetical protein